MRHRHGFVLPLGHDGLVKHLAIPLGLIANCINKSKLKLACFYLVQAEGKPSVYNKRPWSRPVEAKYSLQHSTLSQSHTLTRLVIFESMGEMVPGNMLNGQLEAR